MCLFDYLIVGSGLYGATFAHFAKQAGKRCLVIDKRPHKGGNLYCENVEGINVHKYGAHIFHTSNKKVWDFVNGIVPFNRYTNSPVANYKGELYNLPFNMNTFNRMWGVVTPKEAEEKINQQKAEALKKLQEEGVKEPRNLEEQALLLVGKDIYEKLIKGYTEKQWGRKCTELPPFIIKRLPVRLVFDNNYFNDSYQGIPIGGYNKLIDGLLDGVEVKTGEDFFENRSYWESVAERIVFTGKIDEFFEYRFGKLKYLTSRIIKAMPLSIIQTGKCLTRESSSTSISRCSAAMCMPARRRWFPRNTAPSGQRGWTRIIPSMTRKTMLCMQNTRRWLTEKKTSSLADV